MSRTPSRRYYVCALAIVLGFSTASFSQEVQGDSLGSRLLDSMPGFIGDAPLYVPLNSPPPIKGARQVGEFHTDGTWKVSYFDIATVSEFDRRSVIYSLDTRAKEKGIAVEIIDLHAAKAPAQSLFDAIRAEDAGKVHEWPAKRFVWPTDEMRRMLISLGQTTVQHEYLLVVVDGRYIVNMYCDPLNGKELHERLDGALQTKSVGEVVRRVEQHLLGRAKTSTSLPDTGHGRKLIDSITRNEIRSKYDANLARFDSLKTRLHILKIFHSALEGVLTARPSERKQYFSDAKQQLFPPNSEARRKFDTWKAAVRQAEPWLSHFAQQVVKVSGDLDSWSKARTAWSSELSAMKRKSNQLLSMKSRDRAAATEAAVLGVKIAVLTRISFSNNPYAGVSEVDEAVRNALSSGGIAMDYDIVDQEKLVSEFSNLFSSGSENLNQLDDLRFKFNREIEALSNEVSEIEAFVSGDLAERVTSLIESSGSFMDAQSVLLRGIGDDDAFAQFERRQNGNLGFLIVPKAIVLTKNIDLAPHLRLYPSALSKVSKSISWKNSAGKIIFIGLPNGFYVSDNKFKLAGLGVLVPDLFVAASCVQNFSKNLDLVKPGPINRSFLFRDSTNRNWVAAWLVGDVVLIESAIPSEELAVMAVHRLSGIGKYFPWLTNDH